MYGSSDFLSGGNPENQRPIGTLTIRVPPRVSTDMDSLTVPGIPTREGRTCPSPTVADQRRTSTGFPGELPCAALLPEHAYHSPTATARVTAPCR